jgi:hypothetical protein
MLQTYYWLLLFLPCFLANIEEDYTFFKIFLFNCTNPEAVAHLRAKPQLDEVGPYTFLQEDEHVVISQSETSELFWVKHHYLFVPELSSGNLDDKIVTLNPVPVFAAERTRWPGVFGDDDEPFMRIVIDDSIKQANESLFLVTKVRNITFDGIDSPMLHMGDGGGDIGAAIDGIFPFDRFGYFYDVSTFFYYWFQENIFLRRGLAMEVSLRWILMIKLSLGMGRETWELSTPDHVIS